MGGMRARARSSNGRFLSDGRLTPTEACRRYNARHREAIARRAVEKTRRLKASVYEYYGAVCNCCGETRSTMLSVDHVNNDGYKDRNNTSRGSSTSRLYAKIIRLSFPADYQILCMNCNFSKKRNGGRCEHKTETP